MVATLDRTNIQSLLFEPHRCEHSRHFLFRFDDRQGGKKFLAGLHPRVSHGGTDLAAAQGSFINIGVSWAGLGKLGAFDALGGVSEAGKFFYFDFTDTPDTNSLGAFGASAPANWWNGKFKSADIDLTVHLYCTQMEALEQLTEMIRDAAGANQVRELVPTRDGEAITGHALKAPPAGLRKLHFGYSDGFSQPKINWDNDPALAAAGPGDHGAGFYPRGHFIIDEWDENAQSFPREEKFRDLVRHGSYMALSWVYQDVAGFNRFLADNAKDVAATIAPGLSPDKAEELLAAKMMGRWRDGTPVMLSPNQENPPLAVQDFQYGADPAGKLCPVASHIRIVNGRDQPLDSGHSLMFPAGFPRVLRRGSSYGSWLDGMVDDGQDRGILGMFLCANVNQQFYALTRWIAATNFSDAYKDPNGQDPLFASRSVPRASRRFSIPGDNGKVTLKGIPDFIRMQGVAVMLLPALATLRRLVA
jgi:deferrochelatase/peroxidase EfeB